MIFDDIEQLKLNWTDKYVVVDTSRAELLRFKGMTGTVKTVNMSGRALVQFDAYNNIGWYDIDPKFLTKIDAPLPKPEAKAEKKAAPKAEKPAEKAAPAAKPAGGGMSVADMLAVARKGGGATASAPAAPALKPAAEKPAAAAADPKKMSVADMLAAARANKPAAAAAPAAKKEEAPPPPPAPKVEIAPEPPPAPVQAAAPKAAKGALPKDVDGIVAYCRKTDGKG